MINGIHQIQAKTLCIGGLNVLCCLNLNFPKNSLDLMTCKNLSKTHLSLFGLICAIFWKKIGEDISAAAGYMNKWSLLP